MQAASVLNGPARPPNTLLRLHLVMGPELVNRGEASPAVAVRLGESVALCAAHQLVSSRFGRDATLRGAGSRRSVGKTASSTLGHHSFGIGDRTRRAQTLEAGVRALHCFIVVWQR